MNNNNETMQEEKERMKRERNEYFKALEKTIGFNKWLFDNNIVPNSSFFWFDYTLSREEVCFYELSDLFNAYNYGKTIDEFKSEQKNKTNTIP